MITIPRMKLKKPDVAKLYNNLSVSETAAINYPTNYHLLSSEQKELIDSLFRVYEEYVLDELGGYDDELLYFEEDLNEEYGEN